MADRYEGWSTWKYRLLFLVKSPLLFFKRSWHGKEFLTQVPLAEIAATLSDDGIILEAGAADGSDTQTLARLVPCGRVFAFEPFAPLFVQLREKTKGFRNVTCEPVALSMKTGQAPFFASYQGVEVRESGSLLEPDQHQDLHPEIGFHEAGLVDCVNLDDYFLGQGAPLPDFAWLDLQGMEIAVLESSPVVRNSLKAVWMEVFRAPLYDGAPTYGQVMRTMKKWGFGVRINRVGAVAGNALFSR